jgi:hypothetical protein
MNVKRTAMIGVAAVALAVWISAATTSNVRTVVPVVPAKASVVDKSGAELAVEVKRLHERLRPSDTPVHSRDLFRYAGKGSASATAVVTAAPPAPAVQEQAFAPLVAPLKLEGLAEDQGDQGPVRTAIISGFGDIFLVKVGDSVTSRYRVAKISPDAVELTDLSNNTPLRLALR